MHAILPHISLLALLGFVGLLAAAAVSDVKRLTIPNSFCLGILVLYPVFLVAPPSPVDWLGGLLVAGGVLVVGFLLYATGRVGGGDAKLLAVVSLWAGPELLPGLVIITAIAGGGMAIILWLRHRWSQTRSLATLSATEVAPDFAQQPMPYAVAIFAGGVYVAFTVLGIT